MHSDRRPMARQIPEVHVRHHTWLLLALALAALLLVPAAASALTYDQAVDQLLTEDYPQTIETWLTSQGTSPIGMAFGGSSADNARAEYLAAEFEKLGFRVRLERVPLDAMEFKGASVTISGGPSYVASTFGGVRATPEGGITAPVVYVGGGTAADVAGALDAAGLDDLSGKIALVDAELSAYWMNWQWTEPVLAGAVGVIYTSTPPMRPTMPSPRRSARSTPSTATSCRRSCTSRSSTASGSRRPWRPTRRSRRPWSMTCR